MSNSGNFYEMFSSTLSAIIVKVMKSFFELKKIVKILNQALLSVRFQPYKPTCKQCNFRSLEMNHNFLQSTMENKKK